MVFGFRVKYVWTNVVAAQTRKQVGSRRQEAAPYDHRMQWFLMHGSVWLGEGGHGPDLVNKQLVMITICRVWKTL